MSENRQLSIGGIPVDVADETARAEIATIEAKIPSAASSSNQLADKAYVTSAISTTVAGDITYVEENDCTTLLT